MNVKLSDLTLVGWLLALVTSGLIVVLMIFSGIIWYHILPAGRYPTIMLIAPGLIIGIVFFAIGAVVLKAVGLPVIKRPPQPEQPPREPYGRID
jgi:hypothetical protein